jgi:chromosome segregation ATPase
MNDSAMNEEPMSLQDFQAGKEQRQRMKDDQCRILSSHNSELISSLNRAEKDLETLHCERQKLEEESKALMETNFNLQARTSSAEGRLEEAKSECDDLEAQLKTVTTKSAELFSLLDREEANNAKITTELETCKRESQSLGENYKSLLQSSREFEETAVNAIRENRLKADEIRVLRAELEQLKQKSSELAIKSTVELEALNEQLRLRKEKQYQLLSKLQSQEEASRKAEDHVKELGQNVRDMRQKSSELQTALQLENSARIGQDTANRTLTVDYQATSAENKELRSKLQDLEQARLKLEAEARDNGEQLREMAEKVFQLLERLKLSELGKKKSMEALTKKEHESFALKKQQSKAAEDNANQRRIREKLESEKQVVEDQLRGLQKVSSQLGQKLKEEAKSRMREEEACKEANEKVRTLDGRIAFLLSKLQTDEEARSTQQEEMKKMESQVQSITRQYNVLQTKLMQAEDSAKNAIDKLQESDKQLKEAQIKQQSIEQNLQEEHALRGFREVMKATQSKGKPEQSLAGGQLRFFVDTRPSLGHAVIAGKCPKDKVWIDETGCNNFLRKISKGQNAQESLVEKIAKLYGTILYGEEQLESASADLKAREEDVEILKLELNMIQTEVLKQEEAKRRILLRYISAVKASASLGEHGCEEDIKEGGGVGAGKINLPEVSLMLTT